MKRTVVTGIDVRTGEPREIIRLLPENEADIKELEELRKAGKLDDRESFADDPEAWR